MRKICVCIPTYNRPEAVLKVLKTELDVFEKKFIDLIFFDSSSNGDTEDIISKYINEYPNLFYRKMSSDIIANKKVFFIYEEMANTGYDYIWMIHDHTICNEQAVDYIINSMELNGDFYLLKMQEKDFAARRINGLDEFLINGAWTLNSFGTAIIKRDSFLKGTNWKNIEEKYLTDKMYNYSHIGYYFERMCEINNPIIYQLSFKRDCFFDFMRYERPSWDNEAIRICLECWGNVLTNLPSQYTKKDRALKTQDKWFLSKYNLLEYKKRGVYKFSVFLKYQKWIIKIMPENYGCAFWISLLPYKLSVALYCSKLLKAILKQKKSGRKICLYGAGRHAYECFKYLNNHNMKIDSFLVTELNGNPKEIGGCPVRKADEYLSENSAFIVIAVLTSGKREVELYLDKLQEAGAELEYTYFDK